MKRRIETWATIAFAVCLITGLSAVPAYAMDISGPGPFVLTEDTQLTGDVNCTAVSGPCITFEAPGIELKLNGFSLDGPNNCNIFSIGIYTNGKANSKIEGPGKVKRFTDAIYVFGDESRVRTVVAVGNCFAGFVVVSSKEVELENNIALNDADYGIYMFQTSNSDVQKNEIHGNSFFSGMIDWSGTSNQIENNNVTTNPFYGIELYFASGDHVNEDIALNNSRFDILDYPGTSPYINTVTPRNVCITGAGAAATVCHDSPTPWFRVGVDVRTPEEEQRDEEDTAKESNGSWEVQGNGTMTEPVYWLWAPAYAGALPLAPAPPLPTLPAPTPFAPPLSTLPAPTLPAPPLPRLP